MIIFGLIGVFLVDYVDKGSNRNLLENIGVAK
mgnify:FL=1